MEDGPGCCRMWDPAQREQEQDMRTTGVGGTHCGKQKRSQQGKTWKDEGGGRIKMRRREEEAKTSLDLDLCSCSHA
uniref:Uncharacterized protein n=1 Tax=Macaca fascicularis TaxID=9541 RepID=A0A7N9DDS4_MACFA